MAMLRLVLVASLVAATSAQFGRNRNAAVEHATGSLGDMGGVQDNGMNDVDLAMQGWKRSPRHKSYCNAAHACHLQQHCRTSSSPSSYSKHPCAMARASQACGVRNKGRKSVDATRNHRRTSHGNAYPRRMQHCSRAWRRPEIGRKCGR